MAVRRSAEIGLFYFLMNKKARVSGFGSSLIGLIPVVALAILYFALYAGQAKLLSMLQVFDQYNVLFDTDPNYYLGAYAHGWGRATLVHAGTSIVGIVNRLAVWLAESFGLIKASASMRVELALFVAPLCGAGTLLLVFAMAVVAGCSRAAAFAITAIFGATFSSGVFFSIPESYPLAAPILMSAFLLVAIETRRQRDAPLSLWVVLAIGAALVTITNLIVVCLAFVASRWARRGLSPSSVLQAMFLTVSALAVVVATVMVFNASLGYQASTSGQFGEANDWVEKYVLKRELGMRLLGLASMPTQLIGAPDIAVTVNTLGVQNADQYKISLTYEQRVGSKALWGYAIAGVVFYILLLTGFRAVCSRPLALAGLLALVFNLALHCFFGAELFLYSVHFSTAIIALGVAAQRASPLPIPVLGVLAVTILLLGEKRVSEIGYFLGI